MRWKESHLLRAAAVAVLLGGSCALAFFVVRPLQRQGTLDRSAVLVNVVATMVALPGLMVARMMPFPGHPLPEAYLTRYYLVASVATGGFYGLLTLLLLRLRRWTGRAPATRPRRGRRAFLRQAAAWGTMGGLGAVGGYALLVEPRWPVVRRHRLELRGLPPELHGLRVLQLTDPHLGRFNSAAYLMRVVQRCNGLRPDLVLLTGDYVQGSWRYFAPVAAILGQLRPRIATLGVLGNHDHWEGAARCREQLERHGVQLLDNRRRWVHGGALHRHAGGAGLCLAGVGDLWEDRVALEEVLSGVDRATPRLLLSHNPDVAETVAARRTRHRVDLMLSGHTHGGQVRLPGGKSLISPSSYGSKYDSGFVQGPSFRVFVSTGIGTTVLPVRLLVRPEIVLLQLQRKV